MEETDQRISNSDNRRRAKIEVICGGGLGGLLVVGGALAAVALIGVFTNRAKKERREPIKGEEKKKQNSTEKIEQRSNKGFWVEGEIEEEGLGSVLQISSSSLEGNLCCRSGSGQETQIDSSISKEVKVGDHVDDQIVLKEDLPIQIQQEECNSDDDDDLVEKAIEQIWGNVELSRTDYVDDQIVSEDNISVELQEQDSNGFDEDKDDNDEDGYEREEGSEATVDSSMASNAEPIWPVESIEEESLKLEEMKDRTRMLAGNNGKADEAEVGNLKIETLKKIPAESKMRHKILLWSVLAMLLLLPLLLHRVARTSHTIEASHKSS